MDNNDERLRLIEKALQRQRGKCVTETQVRPKGMPFTHFLLEGASLLDSQDISDLSGITEVGGQ